MLGAGKKLGPYQILGPLGSVGMGEVYRGRDSRLERDVAIKLLPEQLAGDAKALLRFEREAKAVAALSHPNILAIHDFGTCDGTTFAVMELLEGETLRSRLTRENLPWRVAVEIGSAIADGLCAAHAKGIIHRDLKPENLFLTADGRVKILDFGLARLDTPVSMTADTQSHHPALTDPGIVMGTVGYMSPEQVRGQFVDARSDLFSLGCVLYEVVSGKPAFQRTSAAETMVAVLHDDPPAPSSYGKRIPPGLDRVISHCLEKDVERRFHSAQDLAFALKSIVSDSIQVMPGHSTSPRRTQLAVAIGASVVFLTLLLAIGFRLNRPSMERGSQTASEGRTAIRSLAVLPFVYQSGDADAEFLSDGIPMSLTTSLSRVGELRIRPFSSVFPFKSEAAIDPISVGRKLGVQAVLTGTVRKRGDGLFITCELVDVQTDSVLPGLEPYQRKLEDLFKVQEELAQGIADQLRIQLSGEDRRLLASQPTGDREAYRLYVLGRREWEEHTGASFLKSIGHHTKAIERDRNYPLPYAAIADCYVQLGMDWLTPSEAYPKAKEYASKALQLDPTLAEAHVSLSTYHLYYEWNWPAARKELDLALELNSNLADAYHFYCHYFETLGRTDEAITKMKRAGELDPTSATLTMELGWAYYHARDYDRAIKQFLATRAQDPTFTMTALYLAQAYEQVSNHKDAIDELSTLWARDKDWPTVIVELGYAHAAAGHKDRVESIVDEVKRLSARRYVTPFYIAAIFVVQGKLDEGFEWLRKAVKERDPNLPFLKVEPKFDALRSDPRYADILRSVGIPPS
jgi:serine/threonine protein kinase/tetratricopeptide (TPR) repeat protein